MLLFYSTFEGITYDLNKSTMLPNSTFVWISLNFLLIFFSYVHISISVKVNWKWSWLHMPSSRNLQVSFWVKVQLHLWMILRVPAFLLLPQKKAKFLLIPRKKVHTEERKTQVPPKVSKCLQMLIHLYSYRHVKNNFIVVKFKINNV